MHKKNKIYICDKMAGNKSTKNLNTDDIIDVVTDENNLQFKKV